MTYPVAHFIYGWVLPEDFQDELRAVMETYQDHRLIQFYIPEEGDPNHWLLSNGYEKVTVDDSFYNEDGFNEDYVQSEYTAAGDYQAAYIGVHCESHAYWELKADKTPESTPEMQEQFEQICKDIPPDYLAYLRERFGDPCVHMIWGDS